MENEEREQQKKNNVSRLWGKSRGQQLRVCIEKNNPDSTRLREILSSSVIVIVGDSVEDGPAQSIGANEDSEKEQHLEGSQEQVNDTAFDQHNQSCPQQCDCHKDPTKNQDRGARAKAEGVEGDDEEEHQGQVPNELVGPIDSIPDIINSSCKESTTSSSSVVATSTSGSNAVTRDSGTNTSARRRSHPILDIVGSLIGTHRDAGRDHSTASRDVIDSCRPEHLPRQKEHGPDNPKDRDSDPGIADRAASEEGGCITDVLAREWTRVGIDGVTACCWGRCHCCFCPFDCLSVLDCEV